MMNPFDIILIVLIAVALIFAVISIVKKKGKSCCGDCEKCRGHNSGCKKTDDMRP